MGCGSSLNQSHQVTVPHPPPSSQNINHPSTNQSIECIKFEGKCFLFGQTSTERKIVYLDSTKNQFSTLSSKNRIPLPPIKYQPIDVIYQQSQELFSSNLFSSNSHPPYNFMFVTFIHAQQLLLCGGIDYQCQYVSSQTYTFNITTQTTSKRYLGQNLMGSKLDKLSFMNQRRYSHMGISTQIGKLRYVFVFGGKTKTQQAINHCQKYSVQQKKWIPISSMHVARSTGCCFIFKDKIYLFGGYTAHKKRSKKIEIYDPLKDYWELMNIKLHRGIQAALIFTPRTNQILIIGGCLELGSTKSTIRINLLDQTYQYDSEMMGERVLAKGVKNGDNIYVFGGDYKDNMDKYSIKDRKWRFHHMSYAEYINCDDVHKFSYSVEAVHVEHNEGMVKKYEGSLDGQRKILFGNDNYPLIIELKLDKWVAKKRPVPMALRLRCFMGAIELQNGKYFICGGIDNLLEKPTRSSYIYYSLNNKAIEVQKMKTRRYSFGIVFDRKSVYVFGGKSHQSQVLKSCQKYNLQQEKWQSLPDMTYERVDPKPILIAHKIYILGGRDLLQSIYDIEIYDIANGNFHIYNRILPFSSDIISTFPCKTTINAQQQIIILTKNQVLKQDTLCSLFLPQQEGQSQLVCKDYQLSINQAIHTFQFDEKYYFICQKGIMEWNGDPLDKLQSKVVINLVELLQYPLCKFTLA